MKRRIVMATVYSLIPTYMLENGEHSNATIYCAPNYSHSLSPYNNNGYAFTQGYTEVA